MKAKVGNRIRLTTIHDDSGGTELYWARVSGDHEDREEGSFLFHDDGSVTFKCRATSDEPFVVWIRGNRVIVANSEDQPPDPSEFVFDSEVLDNE